MPSPDRDKRNAQARARYQINGDRRSDASRAQRRAGQQVYREEHREQAAAHREARRATRPAYDRLRMYGLSEDEYQAMLTAQGGVCAICGGTRRLSVDHDHTTGRVRAILCGPCNSALGMAGDSAARLRSLADYLERQVVPSS